MSKIQKRTPHWMTLLCAAAMALTACDRDGEADAPTSASGGVGKADDGTQAGCEAQDATARDEGLCEIGLGVAWNGEACVALSGCGCDGEDCGALVSSLDECESAHVGCYDVAACPDDEALIQQTREIVMESVFERESSVVQFDDLDADGVPDALVLPGSGAAANLDFAAYLSGGTPCAQNFAGLFSGVEAFPADDTKRSNGVLDLAVRSSGGNCLEVVTRYAFDGEVYRAAEELDRFDLCGGDDGGLTPSCEDCGLGFEVCMDIEDDEAACTKELQECYASVADATGETCS